MDRYVAVKMDIRDSQKIPDRSELQKKLLRSTDDVNQVFSGAVQAQFVVTHGDEVQGLLRLSGVRELTGIIERYTEALRPARTRFGIGLGALNTELRPTAIGMDGPAWYKAKAAIEEAEKSHSFVRFRGFGEEADRLLDGLANLIYFVGSGWTEEQRGTIALADQGFLQTWIAKQVQVTDAAISRRLSHAGWREYREGREALKALLASTVADE